MRIIEPLDAADTAALQADADSPPYVENEADQQHVFFVADNVLRKLVDCADLLRQPSHQSEAAARQHMTQVMRDKMGYDAQHWLRVLSIDARRDAARRAMDVMAGGKVYWRAVADLYDAGLVYRTARSPFVQPISHSRSRRYPPPSSCTFSQHTFPGAPLTSIADDRVRGVELERQVLKRLDGFASASDVPAKTLGGAPTPSPDLRCSYTLLFTSLAEVVLREEPVLYRPTSSLT